MTDMDTRIAFSCFDADEVLVRQEYKPERYAPEEYVLVHESSIVHLHNAMYDCSEALYLVLEHAAYQNKDGDARGYYENLNLIFKRFIQIGNLLDADLMRAKHLSGPGKNICAALRQ